MVRLADAERFLWANARLIDRRRYAVHFQDGAPAAVLAALRPYQNADGGFGNALEPDLRGPDSQPQAIAIAFHVLAELNAFSDPLMSAACDFLVTVSRTTGDGGVPFVLPTASAVPHSPWYTPPSAPSSSLSPTATLAGLLHKHAVRHPWLEPATDYCWRAIDNWGKDDAYNAFSTLLFLEHVPDRSRALAMFERVSAGLLEHNVIEFDPRASGETHPPLDFAPRPDSLARSLFPDDVLNAHLDALEAAQHDDGGWRVNWPIWTPVTGPEWHGWKTLDALLTLRAWGRLG